MAYKSRIKQRIYNREYQRKRRQLIKSLGNVCPECIEKLLKKPDAADVHNWPGGAD